MWTRVELKDYAKDFLRKHYWKAFLVCLIVIIFSGNHVSRSNNVQYRYEYNYSNIDELNNRGKVPLETNNRGLNKFLQIIGIRPIIYVGMGVYISLFILFVLFLITIGNVLDVGKNRFFLRGFKEDVDVKYLLSTFNKDEYFGIVKNMFLMGFFNLLWYFLFIIPGIIKSYEYKMVPYILTEDANISITEAIGRSREMTEGHKWDMFVLDLSFIGWNLLGSLFFGIGGIFVKPYIEATFARLYVVLSGNDDNDQYDEIPILE